MKKILFITKDIFLTCGSDERQFNYPGIDLNIGSIMKTQYGEFNEYHTSDDNLLFIKPKALNDTFEIYERCLYIFENNHKFINTKLCEPRLSKYNLYSHIGGDTIKRDINIDNNIVKTFYYYDSYNDVISISKILNITFDKLIIIINLLLELKLIKVVF